MKPNRPDQIPKLMAERENEVLIRQGIGVPPTGIDAWLTGRCQFLAPPHSWDALYTTGSL